MGERAGFFINSRGRQLFHVLHGEPRHAAVTWIFCAPLFEEHVFSRTVLAHFARRLSNVGHAVLRFDYEGDGDSEGETTELAATDWIDDIVAAGRYVNEQHGARELRVFGLRGGALLAVHSAQRLAAAALLLWQPVVDGAGYLSECLRSHVTRQLASFKRVVQTREQMIEALDQGGVIDLFGFPIRAAWTRSLQCLTLADGLHRLALPTDVIQIVRAGQAASPTLARLANDRTRIHVATAPGFWGETREHDDDPHELFELSCALACAPVLAVPD